MHTAGAFGFASAAYHWQRVAGAIVRLEHICAGWSWHCIICSLLTMACCWQGAKGFWRKQLSWLYVLRFGFTGSALVLEEGSWWDQVGVDRLYQLDVETFAKGLSDARVAWLIKWIDARMRERRVTGQQMKSAPGRMAFVAGALKHTRPFLGPSKA